MNLLAMPEAAPPLLHRRLTRPAPVLDLKDIAVPQGRLNLHAEVGDIVLLEGLPPPATWRILAIAAGYAFSGPGRCEHGGVHTGALQPDQRAALRQRMVAHAMQRDELDPARSLLDSGIDAVRARGIPAPLARQQALQALHLLGLEALHTLSPAALSPGQQRLGVLARALACHAPLLVLESPETGLDEAQVAQLRNALWLAAFDTRSCVLMSTSHPALVALAQRRARPLSS